MALFQPTNIIPDALTGWGMGVIDATDGLTVSWQINGQSAMDGYEIVIYAIDNNDGTLTQLYDTGVVTVSPAVYGTSNTGEVQYFTATPISAATLASNGINNTNATDYVLYVTCYWDSRAESVGQVRYSGFNCYAKPTITMGALVDPLTTKDATFTATYAQAEGRGLNWFRWYIAESNDTANPFFDSGEITGSGDISCSYDGFFDGNNYSVRCVIETEDGVQADTGWQSFDVSYTTVSADGSLAACQMNDRSAVKISWPNLNYINGTGAGGYSVSDDELTLAAGAYVYWDDVSGEGMALDPDYDIIWKGTFNALTTSQTAFTITGNGGNYMTAELIDSGATWQFSNHNGVLATFPVVGAGHIGGNGATPDIDWTIGIKANGTITVRGQRPGGGLYPSDALYPDSTLYPQEIQGITVEVQTALANQTNWEEFIITEASIPDTTGAAVNTVVEYFWITGSVNNALWSGIFNTDGSSQPEPTWTDDSLLLANFTNGLSAGMLSSASGSSNVAIYRQEQGGGTLVYLGTMALNKRFVYDYAARSNTTYKYYMFPVTGANRFLVTDGFESNWITPLWWDYTILTANINSDGIYEIVNEYDLSCNVTTSTMSNNNTPAILENFTAYPIRQGKSANYRTGTIQALVGGVNNMNVYADTIAQAKALYALSIDPTPKFLKDRKGELIRIETFNATTIQYGDKYRLQPQTVSLSWVEVDDTDGVSILGNLS